MTKIRQGLAWWCFANRGVSPEALVKAAAEIGYQSIDLVDQEHWSLIKNHGLVISSISGHESIVSGLNNPANHDRIEKEITQKLDLSVHWQIPTVICFSGNRGGLTDEEGAENTIKGLQRLAPLAEEAGVTLILELLNSKVDHTDYQCDHTDWAVKVIEQVNSPHVKILYDIYHMQIMEGDIIRTIQQHHQYFAHYHTAGNPGRHDIDSSQEINYPPIAHAIKATGFDGFLVHEFIPQQDIISALKTAYDLCDI